MKAILVTGTPGSGKTKLSKELASALDYIYLDVNKLIEKHPEVVEEYNKELDTKEVDTKKLVKLLEEEIKKSKKVLVIDSHLSHHISKKYAEVCIVMKCDMKEIKKRLEKRGYSEKKVRENLDSEIFDICLVEALENKHRVIIIDTTKGYNIKDIIAGIQK